MHLNGFVTLLITSIYQGACIEISGMIIPKFKSFSTVHDIFRGPITKHLCKLTLLNSKIVFGQTFIYCDAKMCERTGM